MPSILCMLCTGVLAYFGNGRVLLIPVTDHKSQMQSCLVTLEVSASFPWLAPGPSVFGAQIRFEREVLNFRSFSPLQFEICLRQILYCSVICVHDTRGATTRTFYQLQGRPESYQFTIDARLTFSRSQLKLFDNLTKPNAGKGRESKVGYRSVRRHSCVI